MTVWERVPGTETPGKTRHAGYGAGEASTFYGRRFKTVRFAWLADIVCDFRGHVPSATLMADEVAVPETRLRRLQMLAEGYWFAPGGEAHFKVCERCGKALKSPWGDVRRYRS